jgi:hypothetical protein
MTECIFIHSFYRFVSLPNLTKPGEALTKRCICWCRLGVATDMWTGRWSAQWGGFVTPKSLSKTAKQWINNDGISYCIAQEFQLTSLLKHNHPQGASSRLKCTDVTSTLMELAGSVPSSQQLATHSHCESYESSPHLHACFSEIHLYYDPPNYDYVSQTIDPHFPN